ncbi:phytanoyl-CoA dioxygenase family protein [Pedobacter sp. ASV28]|uniref:phytanoyl-CoA dioxygenase family protein n=1 Tax=Pedobacter sp. ASV28 TaxID=2795123 RepID=UPI0018ECDFDD|nr:phytanoyl-CoA dioxygenase family protein [Pedobacter sp. ASV28]
MDKPTSFKDQIAENGFAIIEEIYSKEEIDQIVDQIEQADQSKMTFRKSTDLFAIRQFLKEVPDSMVPIFNHKLKTLIYGIFGTGYFNVKSIYFDKPSTSNWYVPYHQDLTIAVDRNTDLVGFSSWTVKQQQFAVQPPLEILKNIFTIRIHLDNTNAENGALKVIPKSHLKNIYRPETINWTTETEITCNVKAGGIMIMKPLLLHSSERTTNQRRRRVIHLEFSDSELPSGIEWAEKLHCL